MAAASAEPREVTCPQDGGPPRAAEAAVTAAGKQFQCSISSRHEERGDRGQRSPVPKFGLWSATVSTANLPLAGCGQA